MTMRTCGFFEMDCVQGTPATSFTVNWAQKDNNGTVLSTGTYSFTGVTGANVQIKTDKAAQRALIKWAQAFSGDSISFLCVTSASLGNFYIVVRDDETAFMINT
jgi:hypothetical protein